MPLMKTGAILRLAQDNGFGVLATNVLNYETIHCSIRAAEAERLPVIIMYYPGYESFIPAEAVALLTRYEAAKTWVPVGLHFDHSKSVDQAMWGLRTGYLSVMIDASAHPLENNLRDTATVVRAAHAMDVEVEAELGFVGRGINPDDVNNPNKFTVPDEAGRFVRETGVDFLAISYGNAHGDYISTPVLDFNRLSEIHERVNIPLVLHGSSHIPDEQVRESVRRGIRKVNVATEYFQTFYKGLYGVMKRGKPGETYKSAVEEIRPGMIEFIRAKMRVLNLAGFRL